MRRVVHSLPTSISLSLLHFLSPTSGGGTHRPPSSRALQLRYRSPHMCNHQLLGGVRHPIANHRHKLNFSGRHFLQIKAVSCSSACPANLSIYLSIYPSIHLSMYLSFSFWQSSLWVCGWVLRHFCQLWQSTASAGTGGELLTLQRPETAENAAEMGWKLAFSTPM